MTFTAFVSNAVDPLYGFNDAVFHSSCLAREPLAAEALKRQSETVDRLGPSSHLCAVCGQRIAQWNENVTIPYLSASAKELVPFDYLQFHRSCLVRWKDLAVATRQISASVEKGSVAGKDIDRLLLELHRALSG